MRRARSRPRRGHRRQRPARLQRCLARAVRRGRARCDLCRSQDRRQRHLRERGRRRDRLLAERAVLRRAPEPDRRQRRRNLLRRRHQDRIAREPGRAERDRAQRQRSSSTAPTRRAGSPVGSGNVVKGNCIWGSGTPTASGIGFAMSGNRKVNPRVVKRIGGGYRLSSSSPCKFTTGSDGSTSANDILFG